MTEARQGNSAGPGGDASGLVGRVLSGCVIEGLLGRGGMATVYRARQEGLDRPVAVKILNPKLTRDPRQVDQFEREARTLARLEHPHIVGVHAFGREDDLVWLVCQLIEGGSLGGLLRQQKRLDPDTATDYVRQIAQGLAVAHEAGVVHRDVKPDNVLLARAPGGAVTLKLADFGLARMQDDPTQGRGGRGAVVGTPHYMAPEQVDGQEVDARADIYALGATWYQLLTGETPFNAPTLMELLLKHVNEPLVPPHERDPQVPERLSRLVCWTMAKDPAERPASLAELLRALDEPAAPTGAAPVTPAAPTVQLDVLFQDALPTPRWTPPRARLPRSVLYAAGLLVLVTAGGVGAALGPIQAVLADAGGGEAIDVANQAAELALEALDRSLAALPEPQRAARLRAFAAARPDTSAGREATRRAAALEEQLEQARAAEFAREIEQARQHAGDQPGPALDALGALDERARTDAEREALAGARAAIASLLEARGVAWLPPGEFLLGEEPRARRCTLRGLYMDRTEVTCARWGAFVQATGAAAPEAWRGQAPPPGQEQRPVTGISLREALAFAGWCGGRIPDADEWERAARGGAGRRWPWGDQPEVGRCGWGPGAVKPVGSWPQDRTPEGCLDLAGNVAELTLAPSAPPDRPVPWIKGGGVGARAFLLTRAAFQQEGLGPDERHPQVGFRCVADRLPAEGAR